MYLDTYSLRVARLKAGYTLDEAAKRVGIGKTTLSDWERKKHEPGVLKAQQLCRLYKMQLNQIEEFQI